MVRRLLFSLFPAMLLLLPAGPASAASVTWELEPALPEHVENPLGQLLASCAADREGSTLDFLRVMITDPSDRVVYQIDLRRSDSWDLDWRPPLGAPEGIYQYRVEYHSVENGLEAVGGEGFLVAGRTRGICAFKFIDENGNGTYDEGESLASGWEICFTFPDGSVRCKETDEDGAACFFFIPPGSYLVCETLQEGYENTLPLCTEVLVSSTIEKAMFGNRLAVLGACCLPDGTCQVVTEDACFASGGVYLGDGTNCDGVDCTPDGACCLRDGSCIVVPAEECGGLLGAYQGDGTTCDDVSCPAPGACCIEENCVVLPRADCESQNGVYYGDGTGCEDVNCAPLPIIGSSWGRIKSHYR